ncbi:MAG: hypothetical protein ACJ73L_08120 [Actinomycetes bacterium]
MVVRRPLVLVAGLVRELPLGDNRLPDVPEGMDPLAGWYQHSANFFAVGTGTPASGTASFLPHVVGPRTTTYDAFVFAVGTAQSGGSTTLRLALYPDDGTRCAPDVSGGPLRTATVTNAFTAVTTAQVAVFTGGAWAGDPGLYWTMALYTEATTPTTKPVFQCLSNVCRSLPLPSGTSVATQARALSLTGQTTFPTSKPTAIVGGTSAPEVMLRAA